MGFKKLGKLGPAVTIFGSARFKPGEPYYELSRETGRAFAKAGFTVLTGGGPGAVEAANRGAKKPGDPIMDSTSFCHTNKRRIHT